MENWVSDEYRVTQMGRVAPTLHVLMGEATEEAERWTLLRKSLVERRVDEGNRSVMRYGTNLTLTVPGVPPDLCVEQANPVPVAHIEIRRTLRLLPEDLQLLAGDGDQRRLKRNIKNWIAETIKAENAVLYSQLQPCLTLAPPVMVTAAGLPAALNDAGAVLGGFGKLTLVVGEDTYNHIHQDKDVERSLGGGTVVPVAGPDPDEEPPRVGLLVRHGTGELAVAVSRTLSLLWDFVGKASVRLVLTAEFGVDVAADTRAVPIRGTLTPEPAPPGLTWV